MPIAKEQLKIGFTVAANPGNYVTEDAVKTYGWENLVEDGPELQSPADDENTKDAKAP